VGIDVGFFLSDGAASSTPPSHCLLLLHFLPPLFCRWPSFSEAVFIISLGPGGFFLLGRSAPFLTADRSLKVLFFSRCPLGTKKCGSTLSDFLFYPLPYISFFFFFFLLKNVSPPSAPPMFVSLLYHIVPVGFPISLLRRLLPPTSPPPPPVLLLPFCLIPVQASLLSLLSLNLLMLCFAPFLPGLFVFGIFGVILTLSLRLSGDFPDFFNLIYLFFGWSIHFFSVSVCFHRLVFLLFLPPVFPPRSYQRPFDFPPVSRFPPVFPGPPSLFLGAFPPPLIAGHVQFFFPLPFLPPA